MTSPTASKSPSSLAWNVIKIILAVSLVLFVFSRTNLEDLLATLQSASISWLIVSALLYVSLTFLKALQYYILMRNELTYAEVLNVIVWQNAVSNFLLAGAGILTYITTARIEHDVKVGHSITIFLLFALTMWGLRRWWTVLLGVLNIIIVGISRLYAAAHFPLDVLGGALLATGTSIALWPLASWLWGRAQARGDRWAEPPYRHALGTGTSRTALATSSATTDPDPTDPDRAHPDTPGEHRPGT